MTTTEEITRPFDAELSTCLEVFCALYSLHCPQRASNFHAFFNSYIVLQLLGPSVSASHIFSASRPNETMQLATGPVEIRTFQLDVYPLDPHLQFASADRPTATVSVLVSAGFKFCICFCSAYVASWSTVALYFASDKLIVIELWR